MGEMPLPGWPTRLRALAWLAKKIPWARLFPTLAKLCGVLTFRVVDTPTKQFYESGKHVYRMTQVWLANATRSDIRNARATIHWSRRMGGHFGSRSVHGIWLKKYASGLASYPNVDEKTDLPSNGDDRHLGLVVRSDGTEQTYIVCTETYNDFGSWKNYENPKFALEPGAYDVHVMVEAGGGGKGVIHLEVQYGGSDVFVTVH
jgi:hypothetical protein